MKGLKKVALASAIAAISAGAQAELKALDDSTMGEMTGQAGLTIDVQTKWTLGEFMYKDGGSVLIQNINLGGNTIENASFANGGYMDNFRLLIDVAGANTAGATTSSAAGDANLAFGMSTISQMATVMVMAGNTDGGILSASAAFASNPVHAARLAPVDASRFNAAGQALYIDRARTFGNGDLVIKSTFTDPWQKGGGFDAYAAHTGDATWLEGGAVGGGTTSLANMTYAGAQAIVSRAVDFNFGFEVLGLASSAYNAGDAAGGIATSQASTRGMGNVINKQDLVNGYDPDTTTTTLISDLSINGYFGPTEFVIRNRGNGFGANAAGYNYGDAVSKIETGRYFRITDLDVYIDIAGVNIKNLQIHNERGDKSGLYQVINPTNGLMENTSSFGFAHATRDIYAVKDNVLDLGRAAAAGFADELGAAQDLTTNLRARYYTDGITLNNKFKGDIDIPHLSFGNDGRSIGEIYLTDYTNETKLVISAH